MKLLKIFQQDAESVPKTLGYKIIEHLANLEDQKEACKNARLAYLFVRHIPGADIRKCEDAACKNPEYAFRFARYILGADLKKCEEAACKSPEWAYYFLLDIPGADLKKCEDAICQDRDLAYELYHSGTPGIDKKKCLIAAGVKHDSLLGFMLNDC